MEETKMPDKLVVQMLSEERQVIYLEALLDDMRSNRVSREKSVSRHHFWEIINSNVCNMVNVAQLVLILYLLQRFA